MLSSVPRALSLESEFTDPFISYALSLAELVSGVRCQPRVVDDRSAPADVYYGTDHRRPCRIRIPHVRAYTVETIPLVPSEQALKGPPNGDAAFPFDLFGALRFWLADEGNGAEDARRDEHGRLIAAASAQSRIGATQVPIVNAYLALFRSWIQHRTGVPTRFARPGGKQCAVVLTHDVDNPVGPRDPRHRFWLASRDLRRAKPRRALRHLREALRTTARPAVPRSAAWLFRDIVRAEESRGLRSTFFFAPVSTYSPAGHGFDVNYDLAAPRFRRLTRELAARGAEIALHVSYAALADSNRIAQERARVEAVAGVDVLGCRHHYLRMTEPMWPSLEAHAAAGLRYDSSVSFPDEPGFRLGVALATRLWNPIARRPVAALQIPLMAMDWAFYSHPDQTLGGAVAHFQELVDGLKRYGGVAALDWHEYTASPLSRTYGHWGEAYHAVLDLLASDPAIEVLTCSEAMALSTSTPEGERVAGASEERR
jgi:hypothetical protein